MLQHFEHLIENERQSQLLDERCENICLSANVLYLPPHRMAMPVSAAAVTPQQTSTAQERCENPVSAAAAAVPLQKTDAAAAAAPAATAAAAPR